MVKKQIVLQPNCLIRISTFPMIKVMDSKLLIMELLKSLVYLLSKKVVINPSGGTEFFKYEFGVHRVQRIPTNCRKVQTSTAVVTIVPHAKIGNVMLKPSELTIETMRSRGPGGQSVNKSETAVRITHIPTGISVKVQNTSSQVCNSYWRSTI